MSKAKATVPIPTVPPSSAPISKAEGQGRLERRALREHGPRRVSEAREDDQSLAGAEQPESDEELDEPRRRGPPARGRGGMIRGHAPNGYTGRAGDTPNGTRTRT